MGRQEKSKLECYGASTVAGIFDFFDSLLSENPIFWCLANFAGFCLYRNYIRHLVEAAIMVANTGEHLEQLLQFNY